MPYSPTGILTSTTQLPSTLHKSNTTTMPTGALPPTSTSTTNLTTKSITPPTSKPSSLHSTSTSRKHKPSSLAPSTTSHHSHTSNLSTSKPIPSPLYESVAGSPPLTSFLNDRYAASTAQETIYLSHVARLRLVKYILSILTIGAATASLGVTGHVLYEYNKTNLGEAWHLTLWPVDVDLKPTLTALISSAIIIVANILYVGIAIIPSPHSRTSLLSHVHLSTTLITLLLSTLAVAYPLNLIYNLNPHRHTSAYPYPRQSLQSFTCTYSSAPTAFTNTALNLGLPVFSKLAIPTGFTSLCHESKASWGLMAGTLGLAVLGLLVWTVGKSLDGKIERGRRVRYDEKWGDNTKLQNL